MGESTCSRVTLQFDRRLRLEFHGATIASDAGLLACRELDYALELTETATARLQESRGGRNVQNQYPFYANLGAFEPDGDVFCSGVPLTGPVNSADLPWFQRTVQTRDFAIGDYQIGRITGIPVLVYGYPILDASFASARAR